jgi:hypothetical protein
MYFATNEKFVTVAREYVVDGTLAECELALARLKRLHASNVYFFTEQELRSHLAEIERRRHTQSPKR